MNLRFVCLFLALIGQTFCADVIPAARRGMWADGAVGVQGGIYQYRNGGANARGASGGFATLDVTQAPYHADNTGATNATPAVQAACDAASVGDVIYLPPGDYRFNTGVYPKSGTTIRGAGPTQTKIYYYNTAGAAISIFDTAHHDEALDYPDTAILNSPPTGTTTIALASVAELVGYENYLLHISVENDTSATNPVVSVAGFRRTRSFKARLVSVNPSALPNPTITLSHGIPFDLPSGLAPKVALMVRYMDKVGVEDLQIDGANSTNNPNALLNLGQAIDCWAFNVKVVHTPNYLVSLAKSLRCEIRHCDIRIRNGAGTSGAGILFGGSSKCLVVDNIISDIFPSVEVNFGATDNVFAYNFCARSNSGNLVGASMLANHGAHNSMNLYEGNIMPVFQSDGYHGSGSTDTAFRNWIHGSDGPEDIATAGFWAVRLNRFSRHYNIVANQVGRTGQGLGWSYINCGPTFNGTSATSASPSIGYKVFVVESGKMFAPGANVLVQSAGNPSAWMTGRITDYSGTILDLQTFRANGSGTHTDWEIVSVLGYGTPILYAFGGPNIGGGGFSGDPGLAMPSRGVWWRCWNGTAMLRRYHINGVPAAYQASGSYANYDSRMAYSAGDVVDNYAPENSGILGPYSLTGPNDVLQWIATNTAKNGLATWDTPGQFSSDWLPISQNSFQEFDGDVFPTTILKGNATPNTGDNALVVAASEALGGGETYPNSYYLSAKPGWFGTLSWPPFNPQSPNESFEAIPAGYRYANNGAEVPGYVESESGGDPLAPDIQWWKSNEGTGTSVAADVGLAGTTSGTWLAHGAGFAMEFNGTTSQECQTNGNVTIGTPQVSVSLWVDSDNWHGVSSQYLFYNYNGTGSDLAIVASSGVLHVLLYGAGGTKLQKDYVPPPGGSYTHLMVVADRSAASGAGSLNLYQNGSPVGGILIQNNKSGETGNFPPSILATGYRIDGRIDDVRVYSGDRSADASAIYSAGPQ
jgi:hypothetical protein